MQIIISKKFLEVLGSNSILGKLTKESGGLIPSDVTLCFEQTSLEWRKEHGGPESIIIPEFAPMCLCQDILRMIEMGLKINITEKIIE